MSNQKGYEMTHGGARGVCITYDCKGPLHKRYLFVNGDTYTNIGTGHVYVCTKRMIFPASITGPKKGVHYVRPVGDCWKYYKTNVIAKPNAAVTGLTLTRKGNSYTASWNVPAEVTKSTNAYRASHIYVKLKALCYGKGKYDVTYSKTVPISTKKVTFDIVRNWFYPSTQSRRAYRLNVEVYLKNDYGISVYAATARYEVETPRKPVISAITQNANTGVLSAKIDTNKGEDKQERYDTIYTWTVKKSTQREPSVSGPLVSTSTSFTVTKDIPERQSIGYDQYVMVTLGAKARGMSGDSVETTQLYTMSFPKKPTLSVPRMTREPNSGRAVFDIDTKSGGNFPVTGVRFQKLVSVDYAQKEEIPANANWQNVGPQDNGECTAMSIAAEDLFPSAGKKTWIRIKTWNDIESIFYRYSDPIRLNSLETPAPVEPSAGDDNVTILSCKAGADGTSAQLLVGWDADGTDDSNWTEVSWATNERSWRSTEQPSAFTFADQSWNEGQVTSGGKTYRKSAHIDIMDLEPGQRYFIAARRMLKPEQGDATYGPYSTKVTITPSDLTEAPDSVTMSTDGSAIRGEAIPLSWAYNGTAVQQSWSIRKMIGSAKSASDIVLASGNDGRRFFNLPYYRNQARTTAISSSTATSITLYVECKIAGVYVDSEPVTVEFSDRPTFEVTTADRLITQPMLVTAFTDNPRTTVSVVVESNGIASHNPERDVSQSNGDTIWSGTVTPTWEVVSSIADQTEVQQAKANLDSAQDAYDDVMGQYDEAKGRYYAATSSIATLEPKILDETRDLADARAELAGYQSRLDNLEEDDPLYEIAVQDVESATEKVSSLEDSLATDNQALSDARAAQTQAQTDMDAIDYSDEQEELESAISEYAAAVANAIGPTSNEGFTHRAVIELPEGLDLIDNGSYRVRAFATDQMTNISSLEDIAELSVSWAHQAPIPSPEIIVSEFNETDEDGRRTLGTRIELPSPTRALSSDVYDLYRVSRDGAHLALSGVPQNSTVTDMFAPFSSTRNSYVVACRTADGDVNWTSYDYLPMLSQDPLFSMVRIDWEDKYLELDRNVAPSDSFEKDFVSHKHLDGTVSGHWNKGIMRTLSISAAIVRGYEVQQEELLRELARYDGTCLVRTTDGLFVEGNVSVDGISFGSRTAKGDVSLTVTEITPTGTFAPTIDEGE